MTPYSVAKFSSVASETSILNPRATASDCASQWRITPASWSAEIAVGKNCAATLS